MRAPRRRARPRPARFPGVLAAALLTASVGCQGQDGAAQELRALRAEVAALREEVAALARACDDPTPAASAQGDVDAGAEDAAGPDEAPAPAHIDFVVEPVDAVVEVDGAPLPGYRFTPTPGVQRVRVRIERAGYRTQEQTVDVSRARTLRYQLMPGRGLHKLTPR